MTRCTGIPPPRCKAQEEEQSEEGALRLRLGQVKFEMPAGHSRADVMQEGRDALCWELLPNRGYLNNFWLELCFLLLPLMSGWPWTCLFGSSL